MTITFFFGFRPQSAAPESNEVFGYGDEELSDAKVLVAIRIPRSTTGESAIASKDFVSMPTSISPTNSRDLFRVMAFNVDAAENISES